jgi:uncharacterized protein (TIGR02996 family)
MNEEDFFLLDILARPDDDAPRLIYADWLADQGDPRADLVRLGWEQRGGPPGSAARRSFEEERDDACRANGWLVYDGLVLAWEQFLLAFRVRLAEAIAFSAGRDLPLRTERLEPRALVGYFDRAGWPDNPAIDWPGLAVQVAIDRRRLLEGAGRAPSRPAGGLLGGRLVLFDPQATIRDGEAARYSGGYFDADNLPPWDTWVLAAPEPSPVPRGQPPEYTPYYLVSWVPPAHLGRVRAGIDVNEEGSLGWLDQAGTPLVRRLRDAGLLR